MEKFKLELPEILSTKEAFCRVVSNDGLHYAWKLDNGLIIAFEFVTENYPKGGLYIFRNYQEWLNSIPNWVYRAYKGVEEKRCVEEKCEGCGRTFKVLSDYGGVITCPYCGQLVREP